MKHTTINWNPATKEWYCEKCGRTSDHATLEDAQWELNQFECKVPVEMPKLWPHDPST